MSEKKLLMDEYVAETPSQARINIGRSAQLTKQLVELFMAKDYQSVCIVASGSSCNGSLCAKDFMRTYLNCPVEIMTPFTFTHYNSGLVKDSFIVVVSQSGASTNSIDALKHLKSMGLPAIGITGNLNHDFKDYADYEIDYGVVEEKEPYVTKGVTLLALFFMLFSLEAALAKGSISKKSYEDAILMLENVFHVYEEVVSLTPQFVERHKKDLCSMNQVFICAAGGALGAASEGSLKTSELVKVTAVPLETEEYIHGYNLQLTPKHTVFLLDTEPAVSERVRDIYRATRKVTDRAYLITNSPCREEDQNVFSIRGQADQLVSSIYCLPFFQLMVHHITVFLGCLEQHPLLKEFNTVVSSKSDKYAKDYIRRLSCHFE